MGSLGFECQFCKEILRSEQGYKNHLSKEHEVRGNEIFNYDRFLFLTRDVTNELKWSIKKEGIPKDIRQEINKRDRGRCYICERFKHYTIHHRIPNGEANKENLFTLCLRCHNLVHIVLFLDGKWKNPGHSSKVGGWL
ncbi:HNH endonuclease [candidate division WOR-3 bacterium]|nr:HNH endonuclease [candidate division WOR-3 bacterium]